MLGREYGDSTQRQRLKGNRNVPFGLSLGPAKPESLRSPAASNAHRLAAQTCALTRCATAETMRDQHREARCAKFDRSQFAAQALLTIQLDAGKPHTGLERSSKLTPATSCEIGGNERYVSLCRRHFSEAMETGSCPGWKPN
jgi:hypothetical protein